MSVAERSAPAARAKTYGLGAQAADGRFPSPVAVAAAAQTIRVPSPRQIVAESAARVRRDDMEESMVLNMGPQHPSTHGMLRLAVELAGETVVNLAPDVGFL